MQLDDSGIRLAQQNKEKIRNSAQEIANQQPARVAVVKRHKSNLPAGVLIAAGLVGFTFLFINADKQEFASQSRANADYVNENYAPRISDEEIAQANKNYAESFYSADNIDTLKTTVLNDYDVLLNDITENLKINNDENTLNRQYGALTNYTAFKAMNDKDNVDHNNASENDRITKADDLYSEDLMVLKAQLTEAARKSIYLEKDSAEELANAGKIADLNNRIDSIEEAIKVIGDHSLTIDQGKQR